MSDVQTNNQSFDTPSGKVYKPGDRSIRAQDINYAINSANASNTQHNVMGDGVSKLKRAQAWEPTIVSSNGVLIKNGKVFNRNTSLSHKSSADDFWIARDSDYITFDSSDWSTSEDNNCWVDVYIMMYQLGGDTWAGETDPQVIADDYLSVYPDSFSYVKVKQDDESELIPWGQSYSIYSESLFQPDVFFNKCLKKACTVTLSKPSSGASTTELYIQSVESAYPDPIIRTNLSIKNLDIINVYKGNTYMWVDGLIRYPKVRNAFNVTVRDLNAGFDNLTTYAKFDIDFFTPPNYGVYKFDETAYYNIEHQWIGETQYYAPNSITLSVSAMEPVSAYDSEQIYEITKDAGPPYIVTEIEKIYQEDYIYYDVPLMKRDASGLLEAAFDIPDTMILYDVARYPWCDWLRANTAGISGV